MAILKNTVQVNSGNTGWTRSNVLDALEETIADLGWNSGSQVNGVVTSLAHPSSPDAVWGAYRDSGISTNWNQVGGPGISMRPVELHNYTVDDSGTGYVFQRFYEGSYFTTNTLTMGTLTGLVAGDPVVFRRADASTSMLGSASDGDTVYISPHPSYPMESYGAVRFAATEADAIAGTNLLVFTETGNIGGAWRFYDPAHTDNTQLMSDLNQGDTLVFHSNDNFPSAKGGTLSSIFNITTGSETGNYLLSGSDRSNTFTIGGPVDQTITGATLTSTSDDGLTLTTGVNADISMIGNNSFGPAYANAENKNPSVTWDFNTSTLPAGVSVASYSVLLEDLTAAPGGTPLIHWDVSDIPANVNTIPADASAITGATINQNFGGTAPNTNGVSAVGYSGPQPGLTENHIYRLSVTAQLSGDSTGTLTQGIEFNFDTANSLTAGGGTTAAADNLTFTYTVASSGGDPAISVYEGDTITFDNTATNVSHPMYIRVSDGGASVSSPAAIGEGTATVSWTPTTAGTYYYQCGSHPLMIGTITVTAAPTGDSAITANPLWFQDASGAYDTTRTINNTTNYVAISTSYRGYPTLDYGYVGGATGLTWHTIGWGHDQTFYIKSENDATYTVPFTLNIAPGRTHNGNGKMENPYYDYTVPQDGSRSALNLRIYREDNTVPSKIAGIRVRDLNSTGWSESDTFTIPGTAVGGTSPTDDIPVGVSTDESYPGASDGTASLHVTNFGAGVNAYVKNPVANQIIFRLENDATKTYGTTYQIIELSDDHTLRMVSGSSLNFLGFDPKSGVQSYRGRWGGTAGLDWSEHYGVEFRTDGALDSVNMMDFATSSTPTAYPLKIVTYRAQSPQDTDFAIISFVQTINAVDTTYATWFYHKGNNYGNGIWDLDHVWQGGLTTITPTTAQDYSLIFTTSGNHPNDQGHEQEDASDVQSERIMREALYGYFRSPSSSNTYGYSQSYWSSNMWTNNDLSAASSTVTPYFRHHEYDDLNQPNDYNLDYRMYAGNQNDYDAQKNKSMPAAANYYRPLKGLPIDINLAPCPYYLPDDFVMIPFDISPGMASIRPGDTVTISGSEVYEVVRASYENNDETYDGITDNRTRGVIFAARTT